MDRFSCNILSPEVLNKPNRLTPPFSWCGHIPFAFWLANTLKPRTFVELGTHTGNSYFSFCQAIKSSKTGTRCIAVDTWEGDDHAGYYGDSIYHEVKSHNDQHYQEFSRLIRSTFDNALSQVEDSSIDLLHIDGLHTYEAVKHDFLTWLPKVSEQGIVLFHDTTITREGFGVWKFWKELSTQYPSFEFSHSCGLGVLGVGKTIHSAARELFELDDEKRLLTQSLFSQLGKAILMEAEANKADQDKKEIKDDISWLREQVNTRDNDINWLTTQLDSKNNEITQLEHKLSETRDELSNTQRRLLELQSNITPAVRLITTTNNMKQASMFWLKSKIKGTPLAPPAFWLNAKLSRLSQILRKLPESRQNPKALDMLARHRQHTLLSDAHRRWLTESLATSHLPSIDFSVVTHNSAKWITPFLESLLKVNYPISKLDIYFVDNASTDNSVHLLQLFQKEHGKKFSSFNIVEQKNLGFGLGHHTAITQGHNPFVLVTNVDLTLTPNALANVISRATTDTESTASWELRQKPYEHPKYHDPVTLEVNWSSHACILIRRSAYERVGGYEPRIFMYGEDVELSYRFRAYGFTLRYVPDAVVWHHSYSSVGEVKPIQFGGASLANAYLRLRYGDILDIVAVLPLQLALLFRGGGFEGSRRIVANNLTRLIRNAPHFLATRPTAVNTYFPFRGFDYEMTREGAFFELSSLADSQQKLPLISVITRTHGDDDRHLKECITSVMNQTYSNIEHIIVEDGGNHKKPLIDQIMKQYDDRFTPLYFSLDKVGRSAAGNFGLSKAKGEYLIFLDEDDLFFPDHIETLYLAMQNSPETQAAYALAWDTQTIETSGRGTGFYREISHGTPALFYQEFSRDVIKHHNFIPIQSILFKRELYDRFGGFDENMTYLEDWDLWKRYAAHSSFKWVKKTTSMFHTPYETKERVQRQSELDSAYKQAVMKHDKISSSLSATEQNP